LLATPHETTHVKKVVAVMSGNGGVGKSLVTSFLAVMAQRMGYKTAIMDADIIISLSHFKGHEMTGFGGALKNLGMGCGSRGGKMEMHSAGKPFVKQKYCIGCRACAKNCAHDAPQFDEQGKPVAVDFNLEEITNETIDAICGGAISYAEDVMF
jgi:uncharacterized Fe-S center protein